MGFVERRLGVRQMNQDLQVRTALMKVDDLSLNMSMTGLKIEDATKLPLVNTFTSETEIS